MKSSFFPALLAGLLVGSVTGCGSSAPEKVETSVSASDSSYEDQVLNDYGSEEYKKSMTGGK